MGISLGCAIARTLRRHLAVKSCTAVASLVKHNCLRIAEGKTGFSKADQEKTQSHFQLFTFHRVINIHTTQREKTEMVFTLFVSKEAGKLLSAHFLSRTFPIGPFNPQEQFVENPNAPVSRLFGGK